MRHCLLLNHYGADAVTKHEDGGQLSSPKLIDPDACTMEWQVAKKKMTIDSTKKKPVETALYTRQGVPAHPHEIGWTDAHHACQTTECESIQHSKSHRDQ